MDYEQKYKEALERMKSWVRGEHPECFSEAQKAAEFIFPELKESRDERIKQEILELVSIAGNGNQFEEIKDWLEKQGEHKPYGQRKECEDCQFNYAGECKGYCALKRNEHKPTDEVKPKFKVGDWIILPLGIIARIDSINSTDYQVTTTDGKICDFKISKQDNYRLWTIQDAKEGDVLYYEFNDTKNLFIVKYVGETKDYVEGHFCYYITQDGREAWDDALLYLNIASICNAMPATKEQRDILFAKMKEAGYEWDSKNKELKKIESKMLDTDKVIEWLRENVPMFWEVPCSTNRIIDKFKGDFEI